MSEVQVPDLSGHVVANWRLVRRLGVGSFGAVYEAHNTSIDKEAALKILLPQWAVNPAVVARFLREASAASRARHPSVVEFYDGGTSADGLCYIVMELCSGSPLSQHLKAGPLGPARTIRLGSQLADALEAVHAQKVVHRDLKPDNRVQPGPSRTGRADCRGEAVIDDVGGLAQEKRLGAVEVQTGASATGYRKGLPRRRDIR